jgi:hypothetical protein
MTEITRNEFLGLGATLAAGLATGCTPGGPSPGGALEELTTADLVVLNGRVLIIS